jgi:pyruvate dehydrogenase E1 component alpha subunit
MFGDGATNIGYFHESLNLSKVWKLRLLWICENNQYGMGTSVERSSAVVEMKQKAEGYEMPNSSVNGMDVLAVRSATQEALGIVRETGSPYFLEIVTYRYRGHSMGDPERYRDSEEIERWQKDDPIVIFRSKLIAEGHFDPEAIAGEEARVEQEIQEAIDFAESSPDPEPAELYTDVYTES